MCIAFPGRVIAVDAGGATVQEEERTRRASTLLYPDIGVGEWVMVAAGTIVERLSDVEAQEIRTALLDALQLVDREKGATDGLAS